LQAEELCQSRHNYLYSGDRHIEPSSNRQAVLNAMDGYGF